MTGRKLALLGILAMAGFALTATDAQAFGKRKRGKDSGCAAPCDPCASGGSMWRADAGPGSPPQAMPGRGTAGVIPAEGTRIPASGEVIPASGVVPATNSYYYDPRTGSYYPRSGMDNQGFVPGVIQGSTGSYYYPSTSPANYAGRRVGGLFRR